MNTPASTAPKAIYLDIGDRAALESIQVGGPWETEGVKWSEDNATGDGIRYVRADLASTASAITDEQIKELAEDHLKTSGEWCSKADEILALVGFARAVLALAAPTAQPTGQTDPWIAQMAEQASIIDRDRLEKWLLAYGISSGEGREQFSARIGSCVNHLTRGEPFAPERAAVEPSQPAAPEGFALVPLRLTRAMDDVLQAEGWQWPDLLAAAESITAEQHDEISRTPAPAAPSPPMTDGDTLDWQMIGIMIEAHMSAVSQKQSAGTSNWGAWIYKAMKRESQRRAAIEASTKGAAS